MSMTDVEGVVHRPVTITSWKAVLNDALTMRNKCTGMRTGASGGVQLVPGTSWSKSVRNR